MGARGWQNKFDYPSCTTTASARIGPARLGAASAAAEGSSKRLSHHMLARALAVADLDDVA